MSQTIYCPYTLETRICLPIPKPKEWNYDLTNTRPITLLEIPRKILTKIMNHRLMNVFSANKVLRGNQFAAIPGGSTMEPLRITHEIIEHAKRHKQELWLLFQDLSKCYDRVNLFVM